METRGKVSLNADSGRVNIRTTAALLEGQMSTSCPAQIITILNHLVRDQVHVLKGGDVFSEGL